MGLAFFLVLSVLIGVPLEVLEDIFSSRLGIFFSLFVFPLKSPFVWGFLSPGGPIHPFDLPVWDSSPADMAKSDSIF